MSRRKKSKPPSIKPKDKSVGESIKTIPSLAIQLKAAEINPINIALIKQPFSITNAILSFAAIAGIGTALYQLSVIEQQVGIAKAALSQTDKTLDLMKTDQRAWIGPKSIQTDTLVAGKRIRSLMVFKNTGRTPGFITGWKTIWFPIVWGPGPVTNHEQKMMTEMTEKAIAKSAFWPAPRKLIHVI